MGRNAFELTARDYFLLGTLAEAANGIDHLPYGSTDAQAKRLVPVGYLEHAATHAANGHEIVRYRITPKGRAAWDAYRFTDDPPPEVGTSSASSSAGGVGGPSRARAIRISETGG